jgi:hypothetical protein
MAQAVSRRCLTTVVRVRACVSPNGIYGGQIGSGLGFLRVRLFPCQNYSTVALHTHLPSGG